jgi:hypothetical protein
MLEGPDAAVLTDELAEYAVLTNREALSPGSRGWHDDNRAHISDRVGSREATTTLESMIIWLTRF